jgi:hypothetical protein
MCHDHRCCVQRIGVGGNLGVGGGAAGRGTRSSSTGSAGSSCTTASIAAAHRTSLPQHIAFSLSLPLYYQIWILYQRNGCRSVSLCVRCRCDLRKIFDPRVLF